jgi:hypothetical protein
MKNEGSPRLGVPRRTPEKMFLTISDLARVRKIFLKEQDIFSVFYPQGLGQGLKLRKTKKWNKFLV